MNKIPIILGVCLLATSVFAASEVLRIHGTFNYTYVANQETWDISGDEVDGSHDFNFTNSLGKNTTIFSLDSLISGDCPTDIT